MRKRTNLFLILALFIVSTAEATSVFHWYGDYAGSTNSFPLTTSQNYQIGFTSSAFCWQPPPFKVIGVVVDGVTNASLDASMGFRLYDGIVPLTPGFDECAITNGYNYYAFTTPVTVNGISTEFRLGFARTAGSLNICQDKNGTNPNAKYYTFNGFSSPYTLVGGDWVIGVVLDGGGSGVSSTSLSRVKALFR